MMTCKRVATHLSTDDLDQSTLGVRLAVRLHLAMCRSCRAFKRQLDALGAAARALGRRHQREPADDFEARLAKSLQER